MSARQQLILDIQPRLIVDLFAGGGGMSVAMEMAWGRSPDIAIKLLADVSLDFWNRRSGALFAEAYRQLVAVRRAQQNTKEAA